MISTRDNFGEIEQNIRRIDDILKFNHDQKQRAHTYNRRVKNQDIDMKNQQLLDRLMHI